MISQSPSRNPRRAQEEDVQLNYEELILYLESLHGAVKALEEDITEVLGELESFYETAHPSVLGRIAHWWRERTRAPQLSRRVNPDRFKDISYLAALKLRSQSDSKARAPLFLTRKKKSR